MLKYRGRYEEEQEYENLVIRSLPDGDVLRIGDIARVELGSQNYNIIAMALFLTSRFISTFLMKYVNTRVLLSIFAVGAGLCALGAITIVGMAGLYCLIGISFFMSLMFPTIYGIALEGVDSRDTTLGAAFLVMAIVGGALMPPLQGMIIDQQTILGHPAVNVSFVLPLICFVIIGIYGYRSHLKLVKK